MTNIIEAIEKQLQAQKDEIFFKDVQIKDLQTRLKKAEKEKAELTAEIKTLIKDLADEVNKNNAVIQGVAK